MTQGIAEYFMPAEAYWGNSPGAYEKALGAQASQTAQYLAMMDQFYAGIESQEKMHRQQIESQEGMFSRQLGLEKEKFAWEKESWEQGFDWEQEKFERSLEHARELAEQEMSLRRYEINTQRDIAYRGQDVQLSGISTQHSLGMENLEFQREAFMSQLPYWQQMSEIQLGLATQESELREAQLKGLKGEEKNNEVKIPKPIE